MSFGARFEIEETHGVRVAKNMINNKKSEGRFGSSVTGMSESTEIVN